MPRTQNSSLTRCRVCEAELDARLLKCPECGTCCPGCTSEGLKVRVTDTPAGRRLAIARSSACGKLQAMHEEIGHALMDALWELDNLPAKTDEAMARLFAVLDDIEDAVHRTRALDELLEE